MKISENGYWISKSGEKHGVDISVANEIVKFFQTTGAKSILDVGCGNGYYTRKLLDAGFEAEGYDGNPFTEEITYGKCKVVDFSLPYANKRTRFDAYDWVLCLEVGEHIPKKFEQIFLDNIASFEPDIVILSWAVPGQGGDGHVNCQTNDYIISEMEKRNYKLNLEATNYLRNCASEYPKVGYWFRQTLMCFRSK